MRAAASPPGEKGPVAGPVPTSAAANTHKSNVLIASRLKYRCYDFMGYIMTLGYILKQEPLADTIPLCQFKY